MLVLLAYDTPEQKNQTLLRKEFERVGGNRVQYSIYIFEGEPHECERVIRYMRRVAHGIPGDIRLFPMEKNVWDAQIIITQTMVPTEKTISPYPPFVKIW
jgi:CRISPR-associated endonuclease Cas2